MSKIKIMTDSACDIPKEREQELGIRILNFPLTVDGEGYREREDFTEEEFYEILLNCRKVPTTAQITQTEFLDAYNEYYEQGYTDLIYVSINAKGSNTYNSALLAKQRFEEKHPDAKFAIHVIDSKTYTIAYGYPVMEAAIKAEKGCPVEEILAYLEDWFDSVEIYFAPYSLDFVKKSGRVSVAAAFVGELMGLRPIINFNGGDPQIVTKVRGDKNVIPGLIRLASSAMVPQTPHMIIGGCLPERTEEITKEFTKQAGYPGVGVFKAGAAIAINAGPKIVGIIVKGKRRS